MTNTKTINLTFDWKIEAHELIKERIQSSIENEIAKLDFDCSLVAEILEDNSPGHSCICHVKKDNKTIKEYSVSLLKNSIVVITSIS